VGEGRVVNILTRTAGRCNPADENSRKRSSADRPPPGIVKGMKSPDLRTVDPRTLRLPPSRLSGADPVKLHRQMARFGSTTTGMPRIEVYEGSDGALMIANGVTRATRVARLLPGTPVTVEVIGKYRKPVGQFPALGDALP
jgi:hypothetical protein